MGVTKDASDAEIKKAYRKASLTHHPDKGGDVNVFQHLGNVYAVLSDPEKRKLYDLGGMEAVERGAERGHGGRRQRGPQKGEPVLFPLSLSLEEMYTGCVKKLRLTRTVCCAQCDGKGGSNVVTCGPCQGRGVRVVVQRLGPGMISQSQQTCGSCRGEGQVIQPGKECHGCMGKKVMSEQRQLEVNVTAGARDGQTTVFPGEGDQQPGNLPGDIIVEFQQKHHDRFERKGHHAHVRQQISLLEALTGFTMFIKHLDGHEVKVESKTVLKPGDTIVIPEEGFPHSFGNGRGVDCGNLYVHIDILFPTAQQLNQKQGAVKALQTALPAQSTLRKKADGKDIREHNIGVVDMSTEDRKHAREEQEWQRYKQQQQRDQQSQHDDYDDDDGHPFGGASACQPM